MERLIGRVVDTLSSHYSTVIIGPRGAQTAVPPSAMLGCPLSPLPFFLVAAALRSIEAARRYKPRLIVAGSGLTAPMARFAAYQAKAPYVVYLHGLDIASQQILYRHYFVPAIRDANLVLTNSRYTSRLASQAGVPGERLRLLHPGVEIPQHQMDRRKAIDIMHDCFALPPGPILLGVGRLTPRKGFAKFVEKALPTILEQEPNAQFVVAGEVPRHSVQHMGNEAEAIMRAAKSQGIARHVHLIGPLRGQALEAAWCSAQVHVFPVQNTPDDPEGFGMVAIEAAAHGIPTVAFASGGVPDAVSDGKSGFLINVGNYDEFAQRAVDAMNSRKELEASANAFAQAFAWPKFSDRLLKLSSLCLVN